MRLLPLLLVPALALSLLRCSSPEPRSFEEADAAVASSSGGPAVDDPDPGLQQEGGTSDATPGVCTEDIDVVLVIDTSSSMNFVLDALEDEFADVVETSNALKTGAHFGAVFFQDNVLLDATGDEEGGKVHLGADSLASAFATMRDVYTANNRNPGDGPDGPTTQNPLCEENALDALAAAATQYPWRANAARIVVLVTDDTFLERPDNYGDRDGDGDTTGTGYPKEGNYPAASTVAETVQSLQNGAIKVFSFTRLKAPGFLDLGKCGTGRRHPSDEAVTYGWSKPYGNQAPIPEQTGGKNFDLDLVKSGSVHLGDAISDIVLQTRCGGVVN